MKNNRPIEYSTYFKRWYEVKNGQYIHTDKVMMAEHIEYEELSNLHSYSVLSSIIRVLKRTLNLIKCNRS